MSDGQAGPIDTDAVAEVDICEDVRGVGDGEGCAAVLILRIELGDDCNVLAVGVASLRHTYLQ